MTERREDIALELARKCVDICFGPNTSRPTNQYVDRVAALLRPHVWQWIPVGERLPTEGETVLTAEDGSVTINYIPYRRSVPESQQGRFASGHDYVTHWAALPSEPAPAPLSNQQAA